MTLVTRAALGPCSSLEANPGWEVAKMQGTHTDFSDFSLRSRTAWWEGFRAIGMGWHTLAPVKCPLWVVRRGRCMLGGAILCLSKGSVCRAIFAAFERCCVRSGKYNRTYLR